MYYNTVSRFTQCRQEWEDLLEKLQLAEVDICEGRYDHVVHMVTTKSSHSSI